MTKRSHASIIIGSKFGRLTIVEIVGVKSGDKRRETYVKSECECGNIIETPISKLRSGNTQSCGCLRNERIRAATSTHGLSGHGIYWLWTGIKNRCNCPPTDKVYHLYPARGIKMCDEWDKDFLSFYNWAVANGWAKGLCIDRIDNDGNYEPSNCRFVTPAQNSRNSRLNRNLTLNGETKCLTDWAATIGISVVGLSKRLKAGVPLEIALTKKNLRAGRKKGQKNKPKIKT